MKTETLNPKEKSVDDLLQILDLFKKSFPEFEKLDTPEATEQLIDVVMKCHASGCKCQAIITVQRGWGTPDIIGYCDDHSPRWLTMLKVGESTKPAICMGIFKSWYKRIS